MRAFACLLAPPRPLIMATMGSEGDYEAPDEDRGRASGRGLQGETEGSICEKPLLLAGQSVPVLLLIYTEGRLGRGETWPIFEDRVILGRATLRFAGQELSDSRMSRHHARLRRDGDRWLLMDLESRNGTYVDGCEFEGERAIVFGTVIRMGNTLLLFTKRSGEASYRLPPDPELIGDSPAMLAVQEAIAKVAGHGNNVLITGETGVGKEVLARAIHRASGRSGRLMAINCGGLHEGVLESQLFGHVRGSFTGAVSQQDGVFRAAEGGTLLLDELGEMPLELQVKLLRAIETRKIQPVGAAQELPVDARIIAATNCDVVAAVRCGRLRADLYARLAQWSIEIPPLRQRRDDIPLLVTHLLARLGAAGRTIEIALMEALVVHHWPFNVRGLLNALHVAVITMPAEKALALCPEVERTLEAERAMTLSEDPVEADVVPETPSLRLRAEQGRVLEKSELEELLCRCEGNVAEAARHLGCTRQQVYRWIKMYGISLDTFRGPRS